MAVMANAAFGCAYTKVMFPVGVIDGAPLTASYISTRDSELQGLQVEIERRPDGSMATKIGLEGASGQASTVNASVIEGVARIVEAIRPPVMPGMVGGQAWASPDLDQDGDVDASDLIQLVEAWGPCATACCHGDLNRDLEVSFRDLIELMIWWGSYDPKDYGWCR